MGLSRYAIIGTIIAEQVPPFKVIFLRGDYARVYAVAAAMLLFCTGVLIYIVSRIKVTEALKLGEE
jgi:putative ABC transport system permease protein